jgi:hypothetical protein
MRKKLVLAGTILHTQDRDCDVDAETGLCRECGVEQGAPCPGCGGRSFHTDGCYAKEAQ